MMMTILASAFLLIGGFFALVASLGVFRFSDFYARVHAATKASTFGFGFTVLAAAMALGTASSWFKATMALAFLFITLPVAAHLLSKSVKSSSKRISPGD